jgi:hypothetical protein
MHVVVTSSTIIVNMGGACSGCFKQLRMRRKLCKVIGKLEERLADYKHQHDQAEKQLMENQKLLRLTLANFSKDEHPDIMQSRIKSIVINKRQAEQRLSRISSLRHRIQSELDHINDATQLTMVLEVFNEMANYLNKQKEKLDIDDVEECMDELRELRVNNKEIQSMLSVDEDEDDAEKAMDVSFMFNTQIDPTLEHEVEIIMQTGEVIAESDNGIIDQLPSAPDGTLAEGACNETGAMVG